MKRGVILNKYLSEAIASMGHGDIMIVCDAGYPIPRDAWRIDLAVVQDVPDLITVLRAISLELVVEKVIFAEEMATHNPVLAGNVREIFSGIDQETIPHTVMLNEMPHRAKVIVRTGAFDPWGNIALISGVDVPKWFAKPGTKVPDYYLRRMG